MRKISPRLLALMMAGAVTVTSITPVTGYQTITVNAATGERGSARISNEFNRF